MTVVERRYVSWAPTAAASPVLLTRLATLGVLAFSAFVPFKMDILVWALVAILLTVSALARRGALDGLRVSLLFLPLIGWAALSSNWSVERSATFTSAALLALMALIGWSIAQGRTLGELLELTAQAMLLALLASWLCAVVWPDVSFSQDAADAGAFKGLLVQKNAMGYFATLATVTTACQLGRARTGRGKAAYAAGTVAAVATVLATTSGTALAILVIMIGLGAGFALLARVRRPRFLALVGVTVVTGALLAVVATHPDVVTSALDKDPTLTGRTRIWAIVGEAIAQRPVTGYGWGALWREGNPVTEYMWAENGYPFYHSHNGYLDMTIQLGYVGLVLHLTIYIGLLIRGYRLFLQRPATTTVWPLLLILVAIFYSATEVVAFRDIVWLLLAATSTIDAGRE